MALSAKDLLDRVKMMPDGPLTLSVAEDNSFQTTLKAKGSARRYTLRGMPGADFPPLPQPAEGAPSLSIAPAALLKLLETTQFAISTDVTRAHLNSALFEWSGTGLRMVTTDGHRLAKSDVQVDGTAELTMLLPLKAIQELRRICEGEGAGAPLELTQSGSSAFFKAGAFTFVTRLVDATFPPYMQVIPKTTTHTVASIPRETFAGALRAVAVAADGGTGGVKLAFGKGALRITSQSPETGEGADELPIEYAGPPIVAGFRAQYILDVLGALDEESITIGISGDLDPMVIKPVSNRDFVAVVMPMRI